MFEEVVVGWWEVKWMWWIRQNFRAQFFQLLKHWLCNVWLGLIMQKNCTLSTDQCHCKHCRFQRIASIAEHTSQVQWFLQNSESCSGSDWQQINQQWPRPFLIQVWLWEVLWNFFSNWAGCSRLSYKIHFLLHITIQLRNGSLVLRRIREDDTWKRQFILFVVSSWGPHLLSFFTFPICFKCQRTVECRYWDRQQLLI